MNAETLELVRQWKSAKDNAQAWQEQERILRSEIEKRVFAEGVKGTFRTELTDGWSLKCVKKQTVSFSSREALDAALDRIENDPEAGGELIASRIVKWKADFSQSEFDNAPEKAQKILREVLVTKQATSSLEIEAPKEK